MTLNISFPPETEARLQEQAAATGKDISTLVREAVEEKLFASNDSKGPSDIPYEQWMHEFDQWIASHKPVGHFVDDSRETIYAGRGE